MNELYLSPEAVVFLCEFVLASAIAAYLLSVKQKSKATIWLALSMAGYAVFFGCLVVITSAEGLQNAIINVVQLFGFLGGLTAALVFAYYFNENPYVREAKWVTATAAGVTLLWPLGLTALFVVGIEPPGQLISIAIAATVLLITLWTLVVHLRKAVRLRDGSRDGKLAAIFAPVDRRARAHRAFALLSLVIFGVAVLVGLGSAGIVQTTTANTLILFGFMVYVFSVVIVYVNHTPEPTTFQVKVVSFALATVVTVLGITTLLAFDSVDLIRASNITLPRAAVDAVPTANGYRMAEVHAPLESDIGRRIAIDNGESVPTAIGFGFPFADETWDTLYVDDDGLVSFGGGLRLLAEMETTDLPVIAPLFAPLHPERGGGVYVRRDSAAMTVTWNQVPHTLADDPVTVQLRLDTTGAIGFRYGQLPGTIASAERGIFPTGKSAAPEPIEATTALPPGFSSSTGFAQSFGGEHRAFIHDRVLIMVWILLGSTLFVLVGFPYLLRSTITQPLGSLLEGMRRVNSGDLNTKVRIPVRDELGHLAHHFNLMTESLQKAEERLRAYAQELELRVEERTAELRRSLAELKATQSQLVQQEKLASLGALTAGIAHEIKNPLNFVNNFAVLSVELADELTEEIEKIEAQIGEDESDELRAIIDDLKINAEKIAEHGKRADGIVKSMLLHSRGKSGERQETNLNALLNEYVNLAFHGMRAQDPQFNCEIRRNFDESIGEVNIIPQDVGRVFINLLNNAFYAVAEKARSVNGQYAPVVCVSTRRTKDWIEIVIEDNGPGIPEKVREKIFEPFFTTKPSGSGTGLGLSLSHDIVTREHGGSLQVESREGEATTFTISLPIRQNGIQQPTP